jgi:pimeloyl-ACP methyl ester carboxylesterase
MGGMPEADVNGIRIHFEERGEGEPMLLVMGLATQLIAWPPALLDALVDHGFRIIRFDNRDIGLSSKMDDAVPQRKDVLRSLAGRRLAKSEYLLGDMADDAVGLLDHLGIESAHVVGVSMGGMISQELAIDYPTRVRSLCSIMSNTGNKRQGRPATSMYPELRRTMMQPRPTDREGAIAAGLDAWRQISGPMFDEADVRGMIEEAISRDPDPYGRIRQLIAINASPDRTARLRELRMPTLVIHGLLDRLVSPSGGMATAKAVPGSRLLMFPDMAHDLPRNRIGEIADAIAQNAARASIPVA